MISDTASDQHASVLAKFLPRPITAVQEYVSTALYDQIVREYIAAHTAEYRHALLAGATKLQKSRIREPNIAAAELIAMGSTYIGKITKAGRAIIEAALGDLATTEMYGPKARAAKMRMLRGLLK